jgi:hypothetical protein
VGTFFLVKATRDVEQVTLDFKMALNQALDGGLRGVVAMVTQVLALMVRITPAGLACRN